MQTEPNFERIQSMATGYANARFDELIKAGMAPSWRGLYDYYLVRLLTSHLEWMHYHKGYEDGLRDAARFETAKQHRLEH